MSGEASNKERSKALFKKGQRCLVRYPDHYYAAVILRARKTENGHFYLIHYNGWSKKYDEEVHQADIVKWNAELEGTAPEGGASGEGAGMLGGALSKRRKTDILPGVNHHTEIITQLRPNIPPLLKKVCLDDHEMVTQKAKMLPLPRPAHGRPSVAAILAEYRSKVVAQLASAVGKDGERDVETRAKEEQALDEVLNGLQSYFNKGLRHFLLYHQEVVHSDEALKAGQPPADVFGAEHFVRLAVKLSELVPVAHMTPQFVMALEDRLHDLFLYLANIKNQGRYFSTPEEYRDNPEALPAVVTLPSSLQGPRQTSVQA